MAHCFVMKTNIVRRLAQIMIVFLISLTFAPSTFPPTVHYANVNGHSPTPPYTNWAKAAASIQEAVDVAIAGDLILVTNGTYETGGRAVPSLGDLNSLAVTKALMVQS